MSKAAGLLRVAVAGASGRMGRTVLRAIAESDDCLLSGALVASGNSDLGLDTGSLIGIPTSDVVLTDDAEAAIAGADAVIDFTRPAVSIRLLPIAAKNRAAHVIGTTGFSPGQEAEIKSAAQQGTIVKSGNMSRGIALLTSLVKQAAKALPNFDIEIVEMHHRMKVDAPSGTALLLGESAAAGRGVALGDLAVRGRNGHIGERKRGAIGFASLRGGTVVGEHQVVLAGPHERIALTHIAEDRRIFAEGALAAARWAKGKPTGLYNMADVLGLGR